MAAFAGATSLTFPQVGLGSWVFGGGYDWGPLDENEAQKAVLAALESGITLIDTAPVYGDGQSETFLGRVLCGRRREVCLASKCGLIKNGSWTDHDLRPQSVRAQLSATLKRLQTDFLDVYQIHYPDPRVPLEEALDTLMRLQKEGVIGAIGLCNVSASQIRAAASIAPVATVQNEYSLLHPQAGVSVLETCRELGISFIGYGVLCGGILSGKYTKEPNFRRASARNYFYKCYRGEAFARAQKVVARVQQVAAERGCPPSAVAIAWALASPAVTCVLVGARNVVQVQQNRAGMYMQLTAAEMDFLENGHAA